MIAVQLTILFRDDADPRYVESLRKRLEAQGLAHETMDIPWGVVGSTATTTNVPEPS